MTTDLPSPILPSSLLWAREQQRNAETADKVTTI
jgi:hypothetical protein